jgi:hypothetical protein
MQITLISMTSVVNSQGKSSVSSEPTLWAVQLLKAPVTEASLLVTGRITLLVPHRIIHPVIGSPDVYGAHYVAPAAWFSKWVDPAHIKQCLPEEAWVSKDHRVYHVFDSLSASRERITEIGILPAALNYTVERRTVELSVGYPVMVENNPTGGNNVKSN